MNRLAFVATSIALVLYLHVESVVSIRCYVCDTNTNKLCADPFDNLTMSISFCYGGGKMSTGCRKLKQAGKNGRVIRECLFNGDPECKSRTSDGMMCTDCTGHDGCNAASWTRISTTLAVVIISTIIFKCLAF
ncbi:UPAR/Ly6 domain-containing protein crok-like [Tubulanus polymorphus]|uniref:UPAR/Ly6 domain-containing protein crok-like n=1 Tax=Tubulanus polymorphus TaxID=672921 RepID=UPI003DA5A1EB